MTVQASDIVIYSKKKYTLIDVERDKQLIDCARFVMPKKVLSGCSACWRGYTAEYKIVEGVLYGVRKEWDWDNKCDIKSEELFLDYTGSCVIARDIKEQDLFHISDFLECYLDFDTALELHFTNGVLDEVRDLSEAINEMKAVRESEENNSNTKAPRMRLDMQENVARKYLKYPYGYRSYKWRGSGPDNYDLC